MVFLQIFRVYSLFFLFYTYGNHLVKQLSSQLLFATVNADLTVSATLKSAITAANNQWEVFPV